MIKTFISHPFSNNPVYNKDMVDIICKLLFKDNILALSPLHSFSYIEKETPEVRELIMNSCVKTIKYDADQLFAFGNKGGCRIEIEAAKLLKVPVYYKRLILENDQYKIIDVDNLGE